MRKNNKTKGRNRSARGRSKNARRFYNTKKAKGLLSNILSKNNRGRVSIKFHENQTRKERKEKKEKKREEKKREKEKKKREKEEIRERERERVKEEKERVKKNKKYNKTLSSIYGSNVSPLENQIDLSEHDVRGYKHSSKSANLMKRMESFQNKHPGEGIRFHIKPDRIVLVAGNDTQEYKL